MLRPSKWVVFGAIFCCSVLSVAIALALEWVPAYVEYCEQNTQTHDKECATYHIALVTVWQIEKFLDAIAGALTALATVTIGCFTYTLWQSSEKMWRVTKISADAAMLSAKAAIGIELPIIRVDQPELLSITGDIPEQGPYASSVLDGCPYENCAVSDISIRNHGRTPAFPTHLKLGHRVAYMLPDNPNYTRIIFFEPGTIIHQNIDPFAMATNFEIVLSDSDRLRIRERQAYLWFYVSLKYDDFMGITTHETRFCWRWTQEFHGDDASLCFFSNERCPPKYTCHT